MLGWVKLRLLPILGVLRRSVIAVTFRIRSLLVGAAGGQAGLDEVVLLGLVVAIIFVRAGRDQAHVDLLLVCIVALELLLLPVT